MKTISNLFVAAAAMDRVVAVPAEDPVVAAIAVEGVVAAQTIDGIRIFGAIDRFAGSGAVECRHFRNPPMRRAPLRGRQRATMTAERAGGRISALRGII